MKPEDDRNTKAERLDETSGNGDSEGGVLQTRKGTLRPNLSQDSRVLRLYRSSPRSILAGKQKIREHGKTIEKAVKPRRLTASRVLKLHYLRWVLFDIGKETYFMYQGIFDTDFDKYTEDAVSLFTKLGITTVFENLEGFPEDWKTNAPAFIKFVRDHQCPSFLEYGEYPYVTADEIKKALKVKAAFSEMLDQMQ